MGATEIRRFVQKQMPATLTSRSVRSYNLTEDGKKIYAADVAERNGDRKTPVHRDDERIDGDEGNVISRHVEHDERIQVAGFHGFIGATALFIDDVE